MRRARSAPREEPRARSRLARPEPCPFWDRRQKPAPLPRRAAAALAGPGAAAAPQAARHTGMDVVILRESPGQTGGSYGSAGAQGGTGGGSGTTGLAGGAAAGTSAGDGGRGAVRRGEPAGGNDRDQRVGRQHLLRAIQLRRGKPLSRDAQQLLLSRPRRSMSSRPPPVSTTTAFCGASSSDRDGARHQERQSARCESPWARPRRRRRDAVLRYQSQPAPPDRYPFRSFSRTDQL